MKQQSLHEQCRVQHSYVSTSMYVDVGAVPVRPTDGPASPVPVVLLPRQSLEMLSVFEMAAPR